jgi:hypothetical protein
MTDGLWALLVGLPIVLAFGYVLIKQQLRKIKRQQVLDRLKYHARANRFTERQTEGLLKIWGRHGRPTE